MSSGRDSIDAGGRLASLINKYKATGQDLTTDARLAEAVLLDAFPESPPEVVRALVEAVRCDVVRQLEESASHGAALAIGLASSHLASNSGLREDLCRRATEAWWSALFPESPVSSDVTQVFAPWRDPGVPTVGLGIPTTTPTTQGFTAPITGPPATATRGFTSPATGAGVTAPRNSAPPVSAASMPGPSGARLWLAVLAMFGAAVIVIASVVLQKALYLAGSRAGQAVGAIVIAVGAALVLGSLVQSRREGSVSIQAFVFDSLALVGAGAVMLGSLLMAWLFAHSESGRKPFTLHDAGDALAIRWLVPIVAAMIVAEVLIANRWTLWPHRAFLAILSVVEAIILFVAFSDHGVFGANTSHGKGAWLALIGIILGIAAAVGRLIPSAPMTSEVTTTH
jgi:hypothetical protein